MPHQTVRGSLAGSRQGPIISPISRFNAGLRGFPESQNTILLRESKRHVSLIEVDVSGLSKPMSADATLTKLSIR